MMAGSLFYLIGLHGIIALVFTIYPPVFCAMIFDLAYEYLWLVTHGVSEKERNS